MLTRVNQLGLKAELRAKEDENGVKRRGKGKGRGRGNKGKGGGKKSKSSRKLKLLRSKSNLNSDEVPKTKGEDAPPSDSAVLSAGVKKRRSKKPNDAEVPKKSDTTPKTKASAKAKAKASAKAKAKASPKAKAKASAKAKAKISKVDNEGMGTGGGSSGSNKRSRRNPPKNDEESPCESPERVEMHIDFLEKFVKGFKADNIAELKAEVKNSLVEDMEIHDSCQFVTYWTRPACSLNISFTLNDKRSVCYYQMNSNCGGSHEQRALLCIGVTVLSVAWRFNLRKSNLLVSSVGS